MIVINVYTIAMYSPMRSASDVIQERITNRMHLISA